MLRIKLSKKIQKYWVDSKSYYSIQSQTKFLEYFFSTFNKISIIANNSHDIMIYDIQETIMDKSKLNIMLCVENCYKHAHYKHYNMYGNYCNNKIKIYLYNHIDRCVINDNFIAIPLIYIQTNYLKNNYESIRPSITTSFKDKKFCLIATSITNENKHNIFHFLKTIGECVEITHYKKVLGDKSCYHSQELMNIFNMYKFVFVAENSIDDGYITEKIFNCYFSRTIPIYHGSNKINYFFKKDSFLNMNDMNFSETREKIFYYSNDEIKYNEIINMEKNNDYDNENCFEIINEFITKNIPVN